MGELIYLHRADDLDDLPTGPPPRLQRPTYRTDRRLDDWLAGEGIDWTAETVGPLTRPRLVAIEGGAAAPEGNAEQTGRPAEDAQTDRPGGHHEE
jgi:hypothetical protein